MNFKTILNNIINKFVPLVKIRTEFKSPWFDSECYQKCKEKEKLHKKFKNSKSLNDEMKFKVCRKEFKNLVKAKMRANLCDTNRNTLTKKIWSYVKIASKNTRIPETIYLRGKSSSDTKVKAGMFNSFLFDQFSEASRKLILIYVFNPTIILTLILTLKRLGTFYETLMVIKHKDLIIFMELS